MEINRDRGSTYLGDGDLGGDHSLIFVLGYSVRQDGTPRAGHYDLRSWGYE
jgi:hypothetical protein